MIDSTVSRNNYVTEDKYCLTRYLTLYEQNCHQHAYFYEISYFARRKQLKWEIFAYNNLMVVNGFEWVS